MIRVRKSVVCPDKLVIYRLAPNCLIVDVTHQISAQCILTGARALRETALLFPEGTLGWRWCASYGFAPALAPIALIGSHRYLELAVNGGSAAKRFNLHVDDRLGYASDNFVELKPCAA